MTEKMQSIIQNPKLRDSSSKLLFADNILSSQFLRDYADMDILRNIRPEDLEDVSDRYVPLYSTERESDTVKRVNLARYLPPLSKDRNRQPSETPADLNPLELPLYIISLVEHKTEVEYNVTMQMLRYMIHIWEDYEKEMERCHPGISSRKDFKYPPILPIVYYEGKERWTASYDLADRILCKELLGRYLPHFQYQLIMLHEYSNAELLKKGDEISLAMLINKIQTPEDVSALIRLPGEQLDNILRNTPEHLLEILAKVLRALLYSMNLPQNEVENAVAKIKERKMGRLFANVTMDIQAERRNAAEARKELEAARRQLDSIQQKQDAAQQELNTTQQELNTTQQELNTAQQELNTTQQELNTAQQELNTAQQKQAIYKHILCLSRQHTDAEIVESLMQHFSLTEEAAKELVEEAFQA